MKNKKQYAVIGLGRFGTSATITLHKMGYEVLAIDSREEQIVVVGEFKGIQCLEELV